MLVRALGNRVEVVDAPAAVLRELRTRLTLPNPRYIGAIKGGRVPIGIDKVVKYYKVAGNVMTIPAACAGLAVAAAKRHDVRWQLEKQLRELAPISLHFRGSLRLYQTAAVATVELYDHGILHAPTGSGKTVMGCAAIADRAQPTMVSVHNKMLQTQWCGAVQQFLGIEAARIGGDKPTDVNAAAGQPVIVAIINSLATCVEHLYEGVGHLIVDECRRVVGESYWRTVAKIDARYRMGLDATPFRRDGLDEAIRWAMGRIVEVPRGPLVASGAVLPAEVEQLATRFVTEINATEHYQAVIAELVADADRNSRIAHRATARDGGQVTIVLSDRTDHVETLAGLIPGAVALHGGLRAKARREAEARLRGGGALAVVATTQLIGEGFDLPAATTLILATPIKWSGRLLQAIGRVLRPDDGKTAGRIVDFADWRVPVLAAGAKSRAKTYARLARDEGTG